jgi:hypothetical protein
VEALKTNKNDPCVCGSGKKFRQCCWLKRLEWAKYEPPPVPETPPSKQTVTYTPSKGPTFWRRIAGRPGFSPPPPSECHEWFYVKDKGWTHESQLKPDDLLRTSSGSWETRYEEIKIRTTHEHPFFVKDKGWRPLAEIKPGDEIRTENGWVQVNNVEHTGVWAKLYNLRVADHHTYFVGKPEWGFAVWAHNASYAELMHAADWSEMQVRRAFRILSEKGEAAFATYAQPRLPDGLSVAVALEIAKRGVSAPGQHAPLLGRALTQAQKQELATQVATALKEAHKAGAEPVLPADFLGTSQRTRSKIMQLAAASLPAELLHGNSLDSLMPCIGYRLVRKDNNLVWKYGITDDYRGTPGAADFYQGRYTPKDLNVAEAGTPLTFEVLKGPGLRRDLATWETATIQKHATDHGRPEGNPFNR